MKYVIDAGDKNFIMKGVVVIEVMGENNQKIIQTFDIHQPSTWDKIGMLRTAAAKEERRITNAWTDN